MRAQFMTGRSWSPRKREPFLKLQTKNVLVATREFKLQYILSMEMQLSFFLLFGGFLWVFFLFRFFGFFFSQQLIKALPKLSVTCIIVSWLWTQNWQQGKKASFIVLYMSNVTATQWVYMACQHSGIECHFQQKPLLLLPFQECIMIYWLFIIKSTFKTLELLQSFKRKVFPWHFPDKDMVQSLDHCYLKNKKLPHQKTKQNKK